MDTSAISQSAQKFTDSASELKDSIIETGSDTIEECCEETESYIKSNPHQSVLIAFGVGALVGMLLLRR